MIVTSRQPLGIAGEQVWRVPGTEQVAWVEGIELAAGRAHTLGLLPTA